MATRVGINGFGRIGRMCLRASLSNPDVEIVAINGTSDPHSLAYLLRYDSVHGNLDCTIEATDEELIVDGKPIKILCDRNPHNLPWGKLGIDIVLESTGKFNAREDAAIHLANGAKKVVITAPGKNEDITIVMGVNEHMYVPDRHHVISNASCTTNCLAPVAKVLHEKFGITSGIMTTVHAFTTDQRSLDNSHHDLRRARSFLHSIVPTTTGAASALGLVIPDLNGRLNGLSLRVPVSNVSLVDLVVDLEQQVTADDINTALRKASEGSMKGIIGYCEEPLVSIDFLGNNNSAIVDALSTMVVGARTAKVLSWYDNEWGYSCRVIDLAHYVGQKLYENRSGHRIAG